MVYLLNSLYSENQPEAWLCGGVLISHSQVLTSAACLTEVSHIYVIAGYKKYVSSKNIEKDECTRTKKQKIVKIIIPKAFNGSTWMQYDVGIGVVEKNYDFLDISFRKVCSYEPGSILINYSLRKEASRSPAVALGWGAAYARQPGLSGDTNSRYLQQTHTRVTNATYCRKQFPKNIEYMFLCSVNTSVVVNATRAVTRFKKRGREVGSSSTKLSTTTTGTTQDRYFMEMWRCNGKNFSSNETPAECLDLDSGEPTLWRRLLSSNATSSHETNDTFDDKKLDIKQTISKKVEIHSRIAGKKLRIGVKNITKTGIVSGKDGKNFGKVGKNVGKDGKNSGKVGKNSGKDGKNSGKVGSNFGKEEMNFGGICQNDHGGPLILSNGVTEMIIGIALNSVYNKKYQCKGPFLYLSTARAGNLIKCLQSKKISSKNPKICSNKYEIKEYNVTWPTTPPSVIPEVSKSCENGKCETTEQPEWLNIETEEPMEEQPIPVQPNSPFLHKGLQYKRPNIYLNFLHAQPSFKLGIFTTRSTF